MRQWLRKPVLWKGFDGERIFGDSVDRAALLYSLVIFGAGMALNLVYGFGAGLLGAVLGLAIIRMDAREHRRRER